MTQALEYYTSDAARLFATVSALGWGTDHSSPARSKEALINGFVVGFILQEVCLVLKHFPPGRVTQIITLSQFVAEGRALLNHDLDLKRLSDNNFRIVAGRVGQAALVASVLVIQRVALVALGLKAEEPLEFGSISAEMLQGVIISSIVHLAAKCSLRLGMPKPLVGILALILITELLHNAFEEPLPEHVVSLASILFLVRTLL